MKFFKGFYGLFKGMTRLGWFRKALAAEVAVIVNGSVASELQTDYLAKR